MRKTSATSAKTSKINGAISHVAPEVHSTDESTTGERIYARYQQAQADMLEFFGAPGWKRTLVAALAGLTIALGAGYLIGQVVTYLMIGAILATNSMFITLALGVISAIWLSIKAGRLAGRVFGSVLTGEADERAIAAYDATRAFAAKLNPMRLFESKNTATVH